MHFDNDMPHQEELFRQGIKPQSTASKFNQIPEKDNKPNYKSLPRAEENQENNKISDKNTVKPAADKYASKINENTPEKDKTEKKLAKDDK